MNDFYFTVETASVKRQNRWINPGVNPTTVWSVKFIEVDRPAALDVSTLARTWGTVLLEFATWGAVKNSEDIWLDVLLGD